MYDKVRLICPDLKVLFISGYTDNSIVHNGILYDSINFLQKPFNASDLLKKVSEVLARSIEIVND